MLSVLEATHIVRKNHPGGDIQDVVTYKNLYLFMVFNKRPGEEQMDPFFSVDKDTGEFKEFSVLTDSDVGEVTSLFADKKRR
jgi:hypothetical protein